ncbi:MAG: Holliday junction resolvase RuvX [Alicyclobacillus sp.]|nr:Holliday junction resolvase RuvX [Alicyclobacillus sp.]
MARILGVDYGTVRIGIALSDPTGLIASSLTVIKRRGDEQAVQEVASLAQVHEAAEVVVGLPLHMDGREGEKAQACRQFAARLQDVVDCPVTLYDERLTTVAAQRMLVAADVSRARRRQVVDAVAAQVLLQSFLDHRNRRPGSGDNGGEPRA